MRKSIPGVTVRQEGSRLKSTTTLTRAGPYTVVLASVVTAVDVELHSLYLGHPAVETHALHLELARDGHRRIDNANDAREELPVTYALERLLLDHAARLRDLVAAVGGGNRSRRRERRGARDQSPRTVMPTSSTRPQVRW